MVGKSIRSKEIDMEQLKACLVSAGIPVTDLQLEQLEAFYNMVIEKNKVMNLTAITERKDFIRLHFLDSLAPLIASEELRRLFLSDEKKKKMIDVGTGAGFPGIPLKILCPELQVTLLDSLQKRVGFLQEVITALSLKGISAIHSRAEDAGRDPKLRDAFDLAVSRAVANLSALSEYVLPFVKPGGTFLSYKSQEISEELSEAGRAIRLLGGKAMSPVLFTLPRLDTEDSVSGEEVTRSFVPILKTGPTPKAYPRKAGTAKRDPL